MSSHAQTLKDIGRAFDRAYATVRSRYAREVPGYCQLWRRLRLRCGCCEGGYFVYLQHPSKFATCACCPENGCDHDCPETMTATDYLNTKGFAVMAIMEGKDPAVPTFLVEPRAKRKKRLPRTSPER